MTALGKISFGCVLGLALLLPLELANAASSSPQIVIPPRNNGPVVCDYRGCFGFGPRQWYRPPGYVIPNSPRRLNDGRIYVPQRNDPALSKPNYRTPATNSVRHQMWCADRYRTYNPGTNLYTTLHNGSQVCRSPYQ